MSKKNIPTTIEEALQSRQPGEITRESQAHSAEDRPERRPLGTTYRLTVPPGLKEQGYEYRYILDRRDRIEMFEGAWWTPVTDPVTKRPFRKASGSGDYLTLYRIKSDIFKEDQIEKAKKPINLLKESAELKRNRHGHEYVPEGHEAVLSIKN